ncbi:MAG: hypothetical protein GEU76_01035 [Alphaproteobacteria bacterium]|nr:hypothetical protein [Alphaproteobacteria bacterium]
MDLLSGAIGLVLILGLLVAGRSLSRRSDALQERSRQEKNSATQQRLAEFEARASVIADDLLNENWEVTHVKIGHESPNAAKAIFLKHEYDRRIFRLAKEMDIFPSAKFFALQAKFNEKAFEKFVHSRQTPQERRESELRVQALQAAFDQYDREQRRQRRVAIVRAIPSAFLVFILVLLVFSLVPTAFAFIASIVFPDVVDRPGGGFVFFFFIGILCGGIFFFKRLGDADLEGRPWRDAWRTAWRTLSRHSYVE